jgi:hypothetical protein
MDGSGQHLVLADWDDLIVRNEHVVSPNQLGATPASDKFRVGRVERES